MKSVTSSTTETTNLPSLGHDMAERLGLGNEVRELKLGPTFTNDKSTAFHTLKYDFKPASVDVSKMALVDVGSNNTMTVTVPHLDGAGTPNTVFKGSQKPYHKECVLIIDRVTGEITLEKLSSNIQVKKTRSETKSQPSLAVPNSNTGTKPIEPPVEIRRSPTNGRSSSRTKVVSGKKREPTFQLPSKQLSPLRASPYHGKSPPNFFNNSPPAQQTSANASLPMIGMDNEDFSLSIPQQLPKSSAPPRTQSPLENNEQKPAQVKPLESEHVTLSDSSSSSSSSDSSDSDSDAENIPVPKITNGHSNGTISSPMIMPDNLLNDDLQLSESESDSD